MNERTKEAKKLVGNWYVANNGPYDRGLVMYKVIKVFTQDFETMCDREEIKVERGSFVYTFLMNDYVYSHSGEMFPYFNNPAEKAHFRRAVKLLFSSKEHEVDL
jgi:hypothetical protein